MKQYEIDPLADRVPPPSEVEIARMVARIQVHGQQEPAVLIDGKIADGRLRYAACEKLGIPLRVRPFDKKIDGDPVIFAICKATRRSLNDVQELVMAEEFMDDLWDRATDKKPGERKNDYAARTFSVARSGIDDVRRIRRGSKSLYEQMRLGQIAKLRQATQRFDHAKLKQTTNAKKLDANVSIDDCDLRLGNNVNLMSKMPSGSIRCVFADPPYNQGWAYRADPTGDRLSPEAYLALSEAWMRECARLLAEDGTLYVVINDAWADELDLLLRRIGLVRHPRIVWCQTLPERRQRL